MDFYSVSIKKDSGIADASVKDPSSGDAKSCVIIMNEYNLDISAKVERGFHFTGWTYEGEAPVMSSGNDIPDQSIKVTDTVVLTAHAEKDKPKDDDKPDIKPDDKKDDSNGDSPSGDNSGSNDANNGGNNNKTNGSPAAPKMGDGFNPVIWIALLLISVVGIGVVYKEKKHDN